MIINIGRDDLDRAPSIATTTLLGDIGRCCVTELIREVRGIEDLLEARQGRSRYRSLILDSYCTSVSFIAWHVYFR